MHYRPFVMTDAFGVGHRRDSYDSLSSDQSGKSDHDEQWLSQVGGYFPLPILSAFFGKLKSRTGIIVGA